MGEQVRRSRRDQEEENRSSQIILFFNIDYAVKKKGITVLTA
jgi:hypothetical protein